MIKEVEKRFAEREKDLIFKQPLPSELQADFIQDSNESLESVERVDYRHDFYPKTRTEPRYNENR